jgi:hypothetical protein
MTPTVETSEDSDFRAEGEPSGEDPGSEPVVLVETVEDSDSGSEGEPDAHDRDKVLRHNWDGNPGGEAL